MMALLAAAVAVAATAPAPLVTIDPVVIPAAGKDRDLVVRVTAPVAPTGRLPVILFSHGSGLSRMDYAQIVDWWARHGYVVLQPDHEDAAVEGFPRTSPAPADLWRTRIVDMRRLAGALDRVEAQVPGLRGHLDHDRLLAVGHSFGGHTIAALMGARVWNATERRFESFADPRIRGAVLLSPPGSGGQDLNAAFRERAAFLNVDLGALRGPLLVIVGAMDDSKVMTSRDADWHADVYRKSGTTGACLLTLSGAHHYLGGIVDPKRVGVEDADPARLQLVREASLALFEDALAGRPPSIDAARNARGGAVEECR